MSAAADPPAATYLLAAHPDWRESRVTRRLFEAARGLPGVDAHDLYASYPDYAIDVAAEQARVARAERLVLLHPVQWYSMPALLKLWLDEVLTWGWAYGTGGTALHGKTLWLVASTGGPAESYRAEGYNRHDFNAFLPPYRQTAALCGMHFAQPLVLHGAHGASEADIVTHARAFTEGLVLAPQPEPSAALSAHDALALPTAGAGDAGVAVPAADRPAAQERL